MNRVEIQTAIYNLDDSDIDQISDKYHTFGELYQYRRLYNALLFNEWARDKKYNVHKSMNHSDGLPCFGGLFVVVAELPTGQISNHYNMRDWDLFKIPEMDVPVEYDGHTPAMVAERLTKFLRGNYD